MNPTYSVWVDQAPSVVLDPHYWAKLRAHNLTGAAIMVETSSSGLDAKWSVEQLAHAGVLARAADVELVLTYWLEPSKAYLKEFERTVPGILSTTGAQLDLDQEGNFVKSKLEGFATLEEAAVEAIAMIRGFTRTLDVRIDFSTFPFHAENSARAVLAPKCDRLYPQAYSVVHRKDGTGKEFVVEWGDRLAPGTMQHITMERAKQVPGAGTPQGPDLCIGLALYDQGFPGHGWKESLEVALSAALVYKPKDVRFWSSKWIFGPRANPAVPAFLKSLPT